MFDEALKKWAEEWAEEMSQSILEDLKWKVDNQIWIEANKLAQDRRRQFEESSKLAHDLYNQVPLELVAKMINKALPLNVRLFNKIKIAGKSLCEDRITYTYYFNDDFGYRFTYEPTLTELKKLIKY